MEDVLAQVKLDEQGASLCITGTQVIGKKMTLMKETINGAIRGEAWERGGKKGRGGKEARGILTGIIEPIMKQREEGSGKGRGMKGF